MMEEKAFCSGFVTVVGRPNVGKSSLVNALVGQKVAIVSPKPQTTRRRIQAVLTMPEAQVVFLDTPGIQRPRDMLGQALVQAAREAMEGVDAVLFLADAVRRRGEEDRAAVGMLKDAAAPVLLVVSKLDLTPEPAGEAVARVVRELGYTGPALGTSVVTGAGLPAVRDWIMRILGPGPKYFPDGVLSDQPQEMLIAELIREQALLQLARRSAARDRGQCRGDYAAAHGGALHTSGNRGRARESEGDRDWSQRAEAQGDRVRCANRDRKSVGRADLPGSLGQGNQRLARFRRRD